MLIRSFIILIFFAAFSGCTNDQSAPNVERLEKKVITSIEIYLMPAFNCFSRITIDNGLKKVQFGIDKTEKTCQVKSVDLFELSLDDFRSNTLIDSFYSQTFLDSIRVRPDNLSTFDGLSIFTVVKRGNFPDTINSSNVYPEILTANIISQIDYISKKTADTLLREYITDLRRYFH